MKSQRRRLNMLNKHNYMKGFITSKTDLKKSEHATYILFNIAEPRKYKNRETGAYENNTQYFPFIAFSKTAEFIDKHLQKHQHVIIDFRMDMQKVNILDKVQSIIRLTATAIEPLESKDSVTARTERFAEKDKMKETDVEHHASVETDADIDEFVTVKQKRVIDNDDFAF